MLRATFTVLITASSADVPWPDFRGPGCDGDAGLAAIPVEWGETRNIAWKIPVNGMGWSSPVVADGRIWITTATLDGERMSAIALDVETGEVLHERVLFENDPPPPRFRNRMNSWASPSPVVAPGRVWVHFGTFGTACLDSESGETLWSRTDINCEHLEGPGSSPILHDDLLIFHADGADVQYVVALDRKSGETRWKSDRAIDLTSLDPDLRKAYGTPIVVPVDDHVELVSTGARATFGYDPATGNELWRVLHPGFSMSARPVVAGGLVLLNTGYMKPELWAVQLGAEGDVTESHVAWTVTRRVPTMGSAVYVDGLLFYVSDGGVATCLDASTGEELWSQRIDGEHSASALHASGRIYFFSRDGACTVVAANSTYEELARNDLADGCMASPAVVGDALIVRTKSHVVRIEEP